MKFFRLATSCRSVSISCLRVQCLLAVGARDQVLRAQPDQTGCQQRGAGTQADQEWFEPGQQARIDFKRARLLGRDDENGGSCHGAEKWSDAMKRGGTAREDPTSECRGLIASSPLEACSCYRVCGNAGQCKAKARRFPAKNTATLRVSRR